MTISLPDEDRSYQSKCYMEEQIVSLLGGRAAEKLMLGDISTGASNDIERASHIARKMVTAYGMSEKLGSIAFESGHDEVFIGKTMGQTRSYSEKHRRRDRRRGQGHHRPRVCALRGDLDGTARGADRRGGISARPTRR